MERETCKTLDTHTHNNVISSLKPLKRAWGSFLTKIKLLARRDTVSLPLQCLTQCMEHSRCSRNAHGTMDLNPQCSVQSSSPSGLVPECPD